MLTLNGQMHSFLRPAELKQVRADFADGKIGTVELKAAEDTAIRDLVAKQKAAGNLSHIRLSLAMEVNNEYNIIQYCARQSVQGRHIARRGLLE